MKGTAGAVLFIAAIYALAAWLGICFGVTPALVGGFIVVLLLLSIGLSGGNRPKAA